MRLQLARNEVLSSHNMRYNNLLRTLVVCGQCGMRMSCFRRAQSNDVQAPNPGFLPAPVLPDPLSGPGSAPAVLAGIPRIEAHGQQGHALQALVERGWAEAVAFGITLEDDVRLYLECMLVLSPRFASDPRLPWATEILRREDLSGTDKMDRIHDHLVFGGQGVTRA